MKLNKEQVAQIVKETINFRADNLHSIAEGDFNDKKNRVRVTVLREGTSKNGIHYTFHSLQQVKGFLETTAKKVYLNHPANGEVKASRDARDWIGNVDNTFIEGNELKADITLFKSDDGNFVYERMKEAPTDFGPSIIGKAQLKNAKVNNQKVKLAENVVWLKSFDIVDSPSAGGKVDAVLESTILDDDSIVDALIETELLNSSNELKNSTGNEDLDAIESPIREGLALKIQTLKEKQKVRKIEDSLWPLRSAFMGSVNDIILAENEYETMSMADRKKELTKVFGEALPLFSAIEFAPTKKAKVKTNKVTEDNDINETVIIESIQKENIDVDIKDVNQLKAAFPKFVESLVSEGIETFKKEQKVEETITENKTLKTSQEDLQTQVKTLTEANTTLGTENKAYKADAEKVAESIAKARKVELITEAKKTTEFPADASTELFEAELSEVELGKDEAVFTETITAKLNDRKSIFSPTKKKVIKGAGHSKSTPKTEKVSESKAIEDDEINELAEACNVKVKTS